MEEEEEGLNDHSVVLKCAEIQTSISKGFRSLSSKFPNFTRIFHFFSDRTASSSSSSSSSLLWFSSLMVMMIENSFFFFNLKFIINGFWF